MIAACRHVALAAVGFLFCALAAALPSGRPPPDGLRLVDAWEECLGPTEVALQQPIQMHQAPSEESAVVARLEKHSRVVVHEAVDIVLQPGIARALKRMEAGGRHLEAGEQVYVLREWELGYYKAWHRGAEVPGGLPIGDSGRFALERPLKTMRWLKVSSPQVRGHILWALDGEPFKDWRTIGECVRVKR